MSTIPARLAQATRRSLNREDAKARIRSAYRDWYRSAPEICTLYALSVSPAHVRHSIRQKFDELMWSADLRQTDVQLLKWRQDYQETMNCWKQVDHVMGILLENPAARPRRTFLERFYEGRDEDASRPAATGV